MSKDEYLRQAAAVWCSTYPRRVATPYPSSATGFRQVTARSSEEVLYHLKDCRDNYVPGFASVYSFPRGHTTDEGDNIPHVDTLMFDFDFDGDDDGSPEAWVRDMSALLVRVRMVVQELIKSGVAKHWRASLSGHKGVHLYLDFDPIPADYAPLTQFKNGLREYTQDLIDEMVRMSNMDSLESFVDFAACSGRDIARLTRVPNTIHEKASKRFDEDRYCVPVTLGELARITPSDYARLTREPREVPALCRRLNSDVAHERIKKTIKAASNTSNSRTREGSSTYNPEAVKDYRENKANENVTLDRVKLHLSQKPCMWDFREDPAAFERGGQSHKFELNAISAMKNLNAPIDVMVEYFEPIPGFQESNTLGRIKQVISRQYSMGSGEDREEVSGFLGDDISDGYRGFNCEKIISDAPAFCRGENGSCDGCRIYDNEFAEERASR